MLVQLPDDYIQRSEPTALFHSNSPVVNFFIHLAKNLIGVLFLIAGVIMIFTPGQGILSIVVGIILIEFPGKQRLLRKTLSQERVLTAINNIRKKSGKRPLVADSEQ